MPESIRDRAIQVGMLCLRDCTLEDFLAQYNPNRLARLAEIHGRSTDRGPITPSLVRAAFFRPGTPSLTETVLALAEDYWRPDYAIPDDTETHESRTLAGRWNDTVMWLALARARPEVRGAASVLLLAADASTVDSASKGIVLKIHERLKLNFVYEKGTADDLPPTDTVETAAALTRAVWGITAMWRQLGSWSPGDPHMADGPPWFKATFAAMNAFALTLGSAARVPRPPRGLAQGEPQWRRQIAELVLVDLSSLSFDTALQRLFSPAQLVAKAEAERIDLKLGAIGENFPRAGTRRAFDAYKFFVAINNELVRAQDEFRRIWARTYIAPDTQGIAEDPAIDAFLRVDGIRLALGNLPSAHMDFLFQSRLNVNAVPAVPRGQFLHELVAALFLVDEFADRVLRGIDASVLGGAVHGKAFMTAMQRAAAEGAGSQDHHEH